MSAPYCLFFHLNVEYVSFLDLCTALDFSVCVDNIFFKKNFERGKEFGYTEFLLYD